MRAGSSPASGTSSSDVSCQRRGSAINSPAARNCRRRPSMRQGEKAERAPASLHPAFIVSRPCGRCGHAGACLQRQANRHRACSVHIACGQPTPEAVVDAWMHSEGHRANIMKPEFTHMGLGCCELSNDPKRYYIYWAQLFITK